jgi:hypothetical protein
LRGRTANTAFSEGEMNIVENHQTSTQNKRIDADGLARIERAQRGSSFDAAFLNLRALEPLTPKKEIDEGFGGHNLHKENSN